VGRTNARSSAPASTPRWRGWRSGASASGRRLDETSPLAGIPACSLLTPGEIAAAVANPTPPRPWFADWGCDWDSYSFYGGGSVELYYYRGFLLGEADGTPADFAGHPGSVLARPGNCWVQFVQRAYTAGGSNRIEAVWVT
jgi:eukaryotic-like serine/threonine-protein kinase